MLHDLLGAVALNFENANARLGSFPLQIKCLTKLLQCSFRFIQSFLRLLGINAGQQFDFLHLEFGFAQTALCLADLSFVFGTGSAFLGLLFQNLIGQLLVFRLLVHEFAHLRLAVELR